MKDQNKFIDNKPLISVLMTSYNREKYIADSIESVLQSSYTNFELIIVDDCSADSTSQIIKNYKIQDSRIKFYLNAYNLGDYPNRNKAVSYAQGDYFIFVDSDDKIYQDSLEYLVKSMLASPHADLGMLCRDTYLCGRVLNSKESINYHFFTKQVLFIAPGGTIIKTSFFKSIGNYPVAFGPANDMYFNLKAASLGNVKFLCKEFMFYRVHENQESNNKVGYIYHNYNYFKDAIVNLDLQFSDYKKKTLLKKNKRRLVLHVLKMIFKEKKIKNPLIILQQTKFSLNDLFHAIFN